MHQLVAFSQIHVTKKGHNNKNATFFCNGTILENKISAFVYLRPFVSLSSPWYILRVVEALFEKRSSFSCSFAQRVALLLVGK